MKCTAFTKQIFLLLFALISANTISAQVKWYTYYLAMPENAFYRKDYQPDSRRPNVELTIIAEKATLVSISFSGLPSGASFNVKDNSVTTYQLTNEQMWASYCELTRNGSGIKDETLRKGITVTSKDYPISVYALSQVSMSSGATAVMEQSYLGTEYYSINYMPNPTYIAGGQNYTAKSGYMIVATANNTEIREDGVLVKSGLTKGDVFCRYSFGGDMTGRYVKTNNPVAFFAMSTMSQIPYGTQYYDLLYEQLPPINQWGRTFVVPGIPQLSQQRIRVVATQSGTNITVSGAQLVTGQGGRSSLSNLNPGDFVELSMTTQKGASITANNAVGVCSYTTGATINSGDGDPSQTWVPPVEQMIRNVRISALAPTCVATNPTNLKNYYALVVAPTATKDQTTWNGKTILFSPSDWVDVAGSGYSFCSKSISNTLNTFDNPNGVTVYGLGYGKEESYYYVADYGHNNNPSYTPGFTVNDEDYLDVDGRSFCNTTQFVLKTDPNSPKDIIWQLNGSEINNSRNQTNVTITLSDGYYTVSMTSGGVTYTTHFSVGAIPILWTPGNNTLGTGDEKRNWNIPANWTPAIVPSACNDVYIPGNLAYYPMLDDATPEECRDIYFIFGSELGRPDLLTYRRAYVQMDFDLKQSTQQKNNNQNLVLGNYSTANRLLYSAAVSATPMARERWYMLSSPLKKVLTGDLGFGGFPLTYLMKFGPINKDNINYPIGQWTTNYTSMVEPVTTSPAGGFAFYMYGYGMTGNNSGCVETGTFNDLNDLTYLPSTRDQKNYGIRETNGIIELPFFADSTELYAHRTQVYNQPIANSSRFYYIESGQVGFNTLLGTTETIAREPNDGNYRFAPENSNGVFQQQFYYSTSGLSDGEDIFVGNPYMSSFDMVNFMDQNSASIYPTFKIWNGTLFDSFSVDVATGNVTSTNPASPYSRYLTPFQGFFLKYKGGDILFDVTSLSTVRTAVNFNLRSDEETSEENLLRIKAEISDRAASYAVIGYKEGASNDFVIGEDVQKLFSPIDSVPEMYSLAGDIPADINFIRNDGEIVVPLGFKTEQTGKILLTFTGMDKYFQASKIEFFDAVENKTIDLTGQKSVTYTFNSTGTGIQNGRFSIRFGRSSTAIPDVTVNDNLKVYGDSKGLYVVSSSFDPVQRVTVYDFQGRKVFESTSGAAYYPIQGLTGHSLLIAKVETKNQVKTVKIVN